jgi:hypothetical protein
MSGGSQMALKSNKYNIKQIDFKKVIFSHLKKKFFFLQLILKCNIDVK